jgi:hypothetical protein
VCGLTERAPAQRSSRVGSVESSNGSMQSESGLRAGAKSTRSDGTPPKVMSVPVTPIPASRAILQIEWVASGKSALPLALPLLQAETMVDDLHQQRITLCGSELARQCLLHCQPLVAECRECDERVRRAGSSGR